jgi:membrane protease YdiL (CAAX protease family)
LIFLAGCFCEELLRAFCLTTLKEADFSLPFVVVLTSIFFALAELGGIPSRLLPIWEDTVAAMTIGVLLALLFLAAGSMLANCSANLIFNLSNMYLMRRRRVAHS